MPHVAAGTGTYNSKMATHIQGVKSVSVETRTAILLMILIYFISACTCQTISLTCPSLHEGSITMFSCSIPTSMCFHENVFFDFQRGNEVPRRLCLTSATGTCDQPPVGGMNCNCVSSNSSTKEYQFNFLGDKATYEGGTLKCNVDCEPIPAGATCQSISYEYTDSTSTSTSTSPSRSPSKETDFLREEKSCSTPCTIALSVTIPLGIVGGAGILLCVLWKTGKISLATKSK